MSVSGTRGTRDQRILAALLVRHAGRRARGQTSQSAMPSPVRAETAITPAPA
jgi:hypothetical protein